MMKNIKRNVSFIKQNSLFAQFNHLLLLLIIFFLRLSAALFDGHESIFTLVFNLLSHLCAPLYVF
jgi:hypothetical protein